MKYIFFTLVFLLFVIPAYAQLDVYHVPSSQLYPEIYIPKKIIYVRSLTDIKNDISKEKGTPVAYLLPDTTINLHSYLQQTLPRILFKRTNNTQYDISIKNATQDFVLVFNQNYNPAWNLTLRNTPIICHGTSTSYAFASVSRCNSTQEMFSITDIVRNIFSTHPLPAQHFMINGLGNAWIIHPTSPDIELTLSFKIQDYFFVGLMISLTTIIISVIYLLFHLKD